MDSRAAAAKYYDLSPEFPPDVPFYLDRLPGSNASVLELGCGTGRVTLPLAQRAVVHGVDHSEAMIEICRNKLRAGGITSGRAAVSVADITDLHLDRRFDLIIAPFRVMQNLATDAQVDGLFAGIRRHLAPGGRCILNVFRPYADAETLVRTWRSDEETVEWEVPLEGGRVVRSVRRGRVGPDPLVLYPELIYREYRGERLVDESVLSIPMRCWYPEQLVERIRSSRFEITGEWGGYRGEEYGAGPELILEFALTP
jgi:SAM-dependent methyltransferase